MGVYFIKQPRYIEAQQLIALFGKTIGKALEKEIQNVLNTANAQTDLFPSVAQNPPRMLIKEKIGANGDYYDPLKCRKELLSKIPLKYSFKGVEKVKSRPISYGELFRELPKYSDATIGKVLDYGLDWGTIKPDCHTDLFTKNNIEYAKVWRGFFRGEYNAWFEEKSEVITNKDAIIQKTFALGPAAIEQFLNLHTKDDLTATQFNKIFTNIQHDWGVGTINDQRLDRFGKLYLDWIPYKFGPIPIIPEKTSYGAYKEYKQVLVELGYIEEIAERHGNQIWKKYKPARNNEIPWRDLYLKRTDAFTRAHISSLMRLYAVIQNECKCLRRKDPRSTNYSVFRDSLVVLSAARNKKITFMCGCFEVEDWIKIGNVLFIHLNSISIGQSSSINLILKSLLKQFASPPKLLFDKIEMYRNIGDLRSQIENLLRRGNYEIAEVLLETVDIEPEIENHSEYPIEKLELAYKTMRAFSSFVRQLLTKLGLDSDERNDTSSDQTSRDEVFYLNELLACCDEIKVFNKELQKCIENSQKGVLTTDIANILSKVFELILNIFNEKYNIPSQLPEQELKRMNYEKIDGFLIRLREIDLEGSYIICVCDIQNIVALPTMAEILNINQEITVDGLIDLINASTRKVVNRYKKVQFSDICNDYLILVSLDANDLFRCMLDLIEEYTKVLKTIDDRMVHLCLLRIGMALTDTSKGKDFNEVNSGITAYNIGCETSRTPGEMAITAAVFELLSEENKSKFELTEEECKQGNVYTFI